MKITLIVACIASAIVSSSVLVKPKFGCPFRTGQYKMSGSENNSKAYVNPRASVQVEGVEKVVSSISNGMISGIESYQGKHTVAVTVGKYTIYYENLDSVLVMKGQRIYTGKSIGVVENRNVEITIAKGLASVLHPEKLLNCACKAK